MELADSGLTEVFGLHNVAYSQVVVFRVAARFARKELRMNAPFHGFITYGRTVMLFVLVSAFGVIPSSMAEATKDGAAVASKGPSAETKKVPDHERMQGSWRIVSFTNDGAKVSKDALKHMGVIMKKDNFSIQNAGNTTLQFRYNCKPGAKAKSKPSPTKDKAKTKGKVKGKAKVEPLGSFDTTHSLQPGKSISQLGIYAFDGDRLRISIAPAGKPRPTDFEAATGQSLFELVRPSTKKPKE